MKKKKALILCLALLTIISAGFAQIEVLTPTSRDEVKACPDYADEILLDRWDMNERTDLGWRIFNTVEKPYSFLTDINFEDGIFSARSVYSECPWDPDNTDFSFANIQILDSGYFNSYMLGKNGNTFPVDADKYTTIAIRMYLGSGSAGIYGRLLWSKNTINGGQSCSSMFNVFDGWYIYIFDMPALGTSAGFEIAGLWEGVIDSIRLDPVITKDKDIKIDWIRLVEPATISQRTITWSGNFEAVDIFLDDDNIATNGNLGLLDEEVSGNSFTFLAGALMPGDYYVAIAPTGTSEYSYSYGYFHINSPPILQITKPSKEGSDCDFISVNFSDPWDMSNEEDIDYTVKLNNTKFTTISYEDLAGNTFNNQQVFYGESQSAAGYVGDPQVFFLHFLWRGGTYPIDTYRYHNLVTKMGIAGTHSTNDGSVVRFMWRRNDEEAENVSKALIIRHLAGPWVMHKMVVDLNELPIENYPASPSQSGWTGMVDSFRIDPHEFPTPRGFFFDEIRLTADWTARDDFTIEWQVIDSDSNPTVILYYDKDNSGFNGTQIIEIPNSQTHGGNFTWDTSAVPEGTYWVYGEVDDGINQNKCYAGGPVTINHSPVSEISLSKTEVYLGAERHGPGECKAEVMISNAGDGTLNWQAIPAQDWIEITPANGSGDSKIEIGLKHTIFQPGDYTGEIQIRDENAWNSPRLITVHLQIYGTGCSALPFGSFDTPLDGSAVSGNIAVTGWVLHDIGVDAVKIKREPVAGDAAGVIGADGLIYLGDAVFIKGARPDIATEFPNKPGNDQAGWGYMMLTNFLPNQGNGTFILHAIAQSSTGQTVDLGIKTIICDNANRIKPFGTIDTPAQGETISGSSYSNFGWALTPLPKNIQEDGTTIQVCVDSVPLGNPLYNNYRADIAELFPGFLNSEGAIGVFQLDTTQYENGIHSITWQIRDNEGEEDGIGSRYFEIQNLNASGSALVKQEKMTYIEDTSGLLNVNLAESLWVKEHRKAGLWGKDYGSGGLGSAAEIITIEVEELERIKLKLYGTGGYQYIGWGKDKSAALPIGSTLNREKGVFLWTPGPGFLGRHILHFAVTKGIQKSLPLRIIVDILPKNYKYKHRH